MRGRTEIVLKETRREKVSHYEIAKKGDLTKRLIDSGNYAQNIRRVVRLDKDKAIYERSKRPSSLLIEVVDIFTTVYDDSHKNGRREYECIERVIK
jgi:hypothetical protein